MAHMRSFSAARWLEWVVQGSNSVRHPRARSALIDTINPCRFCQVGAGLHLTTFFEGPVGSVELYVIHISSSSSLLATLKQLRRDISGTGYGPD